MASFWAPSMASAKCWWTQLWTRKLYFYPMQIPGLWMLLLRQKALNKGNCADRGVLLLHYCYGRHKHGGDVLAACIMLVPLMIWWYVLTQLRLPPPQLLIMQNSLSMIIIDFNRWWGVQRLVASWIAVSYCRVRSTSSVTAACWFEVRQQCHWVG